MPVLATWSPCDAALDILIPLGLATAAGTGLVIDLDPSGPSVGDQPTLADLTAAGPTRAQLDPTAGAVGFLANGGVDAERASAVIGAFASRWPHVILRCPPRAPHPEGALTVLPLLPEPFGPRGHGAVLYQRCSFSPRDKPDGVVLPAPRRGTVDALLSWRRPANRRDPWLRALADVWGHR